MPSFEDILKTIEQFEALPKEIPQPRGPFYPAFPTSPLIFPRLPSPDYTSRSPASSKPILPDVVWGPEYTPGKGDDVLSPKNFPDRYDNPSPPMKDPFAEGLKDFILKLVWDDNYGNTLYTGKEDIFNRLIKDLDNMPISDNEQIDRILKYYELLETILDPQHPEDDFPLEYVLSVQKPDRLSHSDFYNLVNKIDREISQKPYYGSVAGFVDEFLDSRSVGFSIGPNSILQRGGYTDKIFPPGILLNKPIGTDVETPTHEAFHQIFRRAFAPKKYVPGQVTPYSERFFGEENDNILRTFNDFMNTLRATNAGRTNPEYAPTETIVEMLSQLISNNTNTLGFNERRLDTVESELNPFINRLLGINRSGPLSSLIRNNKVVAKDLFEYFYNTILKKDQDRGRFLIDWERNSPTTTQLLYKIHDYVQSGRRP